MTKEKIQEDLDALKQNELTQTAQLHATRGQIVYAEHLIAHWDEAAPKSADDSAGPQSVSVTKKRGRKPKAVVTP